MPRSAQLKCYFRCDIDGPLHRFPKWEYPHTERFNQWKSLLDSETQEKGNNYIYHCIRFCYKHFEDYFKSPPKNLTRNAVPTLHLTSLKSPPPVQEHIIEPSTSRCSQNQTVAEFMKPEPTSTSLRSSNVSRLLLHKKNASPPSNAVMMLGDILDLHFDYKEPDLVNGEHRSPEFKKINPMATIPVLQDGDLTICESHAILKYLVSKYGGEHREKLYPRDFETRAIIDQLMFYDAGVLFVRLKVVALPTILQGLAGPSEQHIADIDDAYSVLEAILSNHLYIATNHLTIADLSLGSTTTAMQSIHKLDSARFPLTAQWLVRLSEEECFKKINAPGVSEFTTILNIFWKKNKK